MKNKIEVLVPKLIDEQSFKKLAKTLNVPLKIDSELERYRDERAYEACRRDTSIRLHKRLYWQSPRPKWPLIIQSESYVPARRQKILKRLQKELNDSGYITEMRQEHLGRQHLTLLILGLK